MSNETPRMSLKDAIRSLNESPISRTVDLRHAARDAEYHGVLAEFATDGSCPFCGGLPPWHTNPVLHRECHWLLTRNMKPYENAREHLLAVCPRHITHLQDLTLGREETFDVEPSDVLALYTLYEDTYSDFNRVGELPPALIIRFGNTRLSGATIAHLHAHVILPSGRGEDRSALCQPAAPQALAQGPCGLQSFAGRLPPDCNQHIVIHRDPTFSKEREPPRWLRFLSCFQFLTVLSRGFEGGGAVIHGENRYSMTDMHAHLIAPRHAQNEETPVVWFPIGNVRFPVG